MNVLIRGGGDIASGVALRLHHSGYSVFITELPQPVAVRRFVSFSEAVYEGIWTVEDVTAQLAESTAQALEILAANKIPVLIAPDIAAIELQYSILVDARMAKTEASKLHSTEPLVIGLGPGFTAGVNCHAVVETNRGHTLGRVFWSGSAQDDTANPEGDPRRVLRSPADGITQPFVKIGQHVDQGHLLASIGGIQVTSPLSGVVRGMIRSGIRVIKGWKIGDIDPRDDPSMCSLVSDKALAVGGGVLEAILHHYR